VARDEIDTNDTDDAVSSTSGLGTVAALAGVVYVLLLITVNNERVDIDLVFHTFRDTPLWWFTALVIIATLVTDRLVRFIVRRIRRRRRD
jgi:hypothetical protein